MESNPEFYRRLGRYLSLDKCYEAVAISDEAGDLFYEPVEVRSASSLILI